MLSAMRSLFLLISLTLSLLLAGCSTPPAERLEAPIARVDSLRINKDTGVLTLRFTQSNIVPMVISRSHHTLSLDDQSMGIFDDTEAIGLPPQGSVAHTVTLPPKIIQAAQAYLLRHPGAVRVSVKSGLNVLTSDDGWITLTTLASGSITAP